MNDCDTGRRSGCVKKTTVESCGRLSMKAIRPHLQPGFHGNVSLSVGEKEGWSVDYWVEGSGGAPSSLHLKYPFRGEQTGEEVDLECSVALTTTLTKWGSLRYWFVCPMLVDGRPCGRRVEILYLPPGEQHFGCRQCYSLTYQSSQTGNLLVRELKQATAARYPYLTRAEVARVVRCYLNGEQTPARIDRKIWSHAEAEHRKILPDPYAGYLTAAELCDRSDLRPADLERLASARLLLPDRGGLYRPKLIGWAVKLVYLLEMGWSLAEIRAWSRGRWSTADPRRWPPHRKDWSNDGAEEEVGDGL